MARASVTPSRAPPPPAQAIIRPNVVTEPYHSPTPAPTPAQPVVAAPQAPQPDPVARWRAPAVVLDLAQNTQTGPDIPTAVGVPLARPATPVEAPASDRQFANRVAGSQPETVYATRLPDVALVVTQGTLISAVLETGINSDLPGFVRAVVTRDVRSFDSSVVLIPRGSTLIGEYKSGVALGQSRAFVVWSRLLTPDGVTVNLGSPGTDAIGRAGLQGETNNHFLQRFGAAGLMSVLTTGLQAVANHSSRGSTAIVIGSPQQATSVANIALQKQIDIPPTITIAPGAVVRVFVAKDLDFSGVVRR